MSDDDPHLDDPTAGPPDGAGGDGYNGEPPGSSVTVFLVNEQQQPIDEGRLVQLAEKTAVSEGASGELSLFLVEESQISEINERYLGEAGPTDVISFPIEGLIDTPPGSSEDLPTSLIGEVVLCPTVAIGNASNRGVSVEDELDLLVVHGVLHLLGYDHETVEEAERMRSRELALIGRAGAEAP